jgi:Uma2 family endonuclease
MRHQDLAKRLFPAFLSVEARKLGCVWWGISVVLGEHDVLIPDLVFVSAERLEIRQAHALVGAPDLAVEILSPSTRARDEQVKAKLYARAGVRILWIVDPDDDRLDVYRLRSRAYGQPTPYRAPEVVREATLPGLEVDLEALFFRP